LISVETLVFLNTFMVFVILSVAMDLKI